MNLKVVGSNPTGGKNFSAVFLDGVRHSSTVVRHSSTKLKQKTSMSFIRGNSTYICIYTHRQKLSNSKLVLNIKKCFVPKYWKFKFYYLHLNSFE